MSGRKDTAPCGHPGEVVIGAYVRCLQGCSKDPYLQPQPVKVTRGEPGHVEYCACKPCTVRRRGRVVLLKTKDGKTTSLSWDGVSRDISFNAPWPGPVRHWMLLDEDGDVLSDGMCDVPCGTGDPLRVDIDVMIPVKLTVIKGGYYWTADRYTKLKSATLLPYAEDDAEYTLDLAKAIADSGELSKGSLRQAAKKFNFRR